MLTTRLQDETGVEPDVVTVIVGEDEKQALIEKFTHAKRHVISSIAQINEHHLTWATNEQRQYKEAYKTYLAKKTEYEDANPLIKMMMEQPTEPPPFDPQCLSRRQRTPFDWYLEELTRFEKTVLCAENSVSWAECVTGQLTDSTLYKVMTDFYTPEDNDTADMTKPINMG